jgi:glycosyltransferase involved in cell wall biosynthesis
MKVLFDFTGPLGSDTGGNTFSNYFLSGWQSQFASDETVAVFSDGQVPQTIKNSSLLVVEGSKRKRLSAADRVIDRHVMVRKQLALDSPDVVYFPMNFIAAGLGRDVPVVAGVQSLLHYHYPSQITRARRVYRRLAIGHAVHRADRVVVPSSATADDLMRLHGVHRRKVAVVPYGVDLDTFCQGDPAAVLPERFLFVSRPWDYKGLATVLRALPLICAETPSTELQLIVADGGMPAEELKWWRGLASALGVENRVQFMGRVPHDRLAAEYQKASALVLPTSIESFGFAFLEAAASGCPVIAGRGHAIDETIGPVATQVPEHQHADIARAMIDHMRMTAVERTERAQALRTWAERFPWSRTVRETRQVLSEVAR